MYNYSPLLTDFYQLTMAYGYWKLGKHNQEACFHLLFRSHPFKGQFALSAGLDSALDFIEHWQFSDHDLAYLQTLKGKNDKVLFEPAFITMLSQLRLTVNVDAMPEGSLVFANTPLIRVQGPLIQCQLLESAILNIINFQTLIATKAARVCDAAQGDPVIEFGMRRAQGPDGALSASRAAFIGGCEATSNTLAGKLFDIPVRGTHAHSWITAFDSEVEAFSAYASVLPERAVLLVDTYNTIEGVKNAIKTGLALKTKGHDLLAIRLDSGDMATLSIAARDLLDDAGFTHTKIMASNSLDENVIRDLKARGAKIDLWGVGTHLSTAYDQPALDGVYKMGALKSPDGQWEPKLKLSEQEIKISNPGRHQVRRYFKNKEIIGDLVFDLDLGLGDTPTGVAIDGSPVETQFEGHDHIEDLLIPVLQRGQRLHPAMPLSRIRDHALHTLSCFQTQKHVPVYLEKNLHDLKLSLINQYTE